MSDFTHNFEADTGKILNIVINSLYSDRDIFLRELLSNASDAIHKRKFLGQTRPNILNAVDDEIQIIMSFKFLLQRGKFSESRRGGCSMLI